MVSDPESMKMAPPAGGAPRCTSPSGDEGDDAEFPVNVESEMVMVEGPKKLETLPPRELAHDSKSQSRMSTKNSLGSPEAPEPPWRLMAPPSPKDAVQEVKVLPVSVVVEV